VHRLPSIRVPTARSDRPEQKRAWAANRDITLTIHEPAVTDEKLALYDAFHAHQTEDKGWPGHDPKSPDVYAETFVVNRLGRGVAVPARRELIGVGYVDRTPAASPPFTSSTPRPPRPVLGHVQRPVDLETARRTGLPYVYLGITSKATGRSNTRPGSGRTKSSTRDRRLGAVPD